MKAFTIIELIFVFIILCVLAGVAISRFTKTMDETKPTTTIDDAEIVRAISNIRLAIQDIDGYYLTRGNFAENISDMTNVANPIMVKTETCAEFSRRSATEIVLAMNTSGILCGSVWEGSNLRNIAVSNGIVFVETR